MTTFPSLKEKEREERKDIIIGAAEKLFTTEPFDRVNMRRIAQEAETTPTTIYRYFADQQALFGEVFIRGIKKCADELEKVLSENDAPSIEEISRAYVGFLKTNEQYFKMMTRFMMDDTLSDEILESLQQASNILIDKFEKLFKNHPANHDRRMISQAFFAALSGAAITFRKYPGKDQEETFRHTELICEVLSNAFRVFQAQADP
jgi:AcrR family transcriptional regulator